MNFSKYFIDRPIFAGVLSLLILIGGLISIVNLPISEYPEVVPPSVVVTAHFPGASPQVISETVAAPIEEQINGAEGMLYMASQANADGVMMLTATFALGTDPDAAQQLIQNRVNQALPRLPLEVQRLGVTTVKSSPNFIIAVHLVSPDHRYDIDYLRNYAVLNVRDRLARVPGVGAMRLFGGGDYAMRIWLDPNQVAAHGLAASAVVEAIRAQNINVAAGVIGASPTLPDAHYQYTLNAQGRLHSPEEFGDIVIRSDDNGVLTRLKDVARIELGATEYGMRSMLDDKVGLAIGIFQAPGANALQISNDVRAVMADMADDLPEGLTVEIKYDPTEFVRNSIKAVVWTLLEAVLLVVIVVVVFLQTWRASIIPLLAVPVSIIGTFAVMLGLGFSINALSLFGLVLSIGIVVDDAIVVVENVERNIERGLSPLQATYQAMREVSGPIVAIAITLSAVFIPLAFISGLAGQFYKQFALTIAISTIISAFNSLTLSPALTALLLKSHATAPDRFQGFIDRYLGWFFVRFNRFFKRGEQIYGSGVTAALSRKGLMMVLYGVLIGLTMLLFARVPGGFVPVQDKQFLLGVAQLPDAASIERTDAIMREMTEISLQHPDVESVMSFPGMSVNGMANVTNGGIVFPILKPFPDRKRASQHASAVAQQLNQKFSAIEGAYVGVFLPPSVSGMGTIGGFKLQLQDRAALGSAALNDALQAFLAQARKAPELAGVFSGFQTKVPQLQATVDRTRAQQMGVAIPDLFQTLQIYLGSMYVNDFNQFGRTFQVRVQADAAFRAQPEDIGLLKTPNKNGEMVPLASVLNITHSYGQNQAMRYNGYPSADINGGPAPGYSSGQAQAAIERIAAQTLPRGIAYEWTELTYQEKLAGNTLLLILPLALMLVFMVLAAQYESLTLPLSVLLVVPMGLLSAITGVWLTGGDNNIFTQISLMVLVALAAKNAIMIVEFARELEHQGRSAYQAAIEASRLRLRPILMTSMAFIAGVVPLVVSTGSGAEMRNVMGIAVFSGMIGLTFFGLLLTPVFYVLVRHLEQRFTATPTSTSASTLALPDSSAIEGVQK